MDKIFFLKAGLWSRVKVYFYTSKLAEHPKMNSTLTKSKRLVSHTANCVANREYTHFRFEI